MPEGTGFEFFIFRGVGQALIRDSGSVAKTIMASSVRHQRLLRNNAHFTTNAKTTNGPKKLARQPAINSPSKLGCFGGRK